MVDVKPAFPVIKRLMVCVDNSSRPRVVETSTSKVTYTNEYRLVGWIIFLHLGINCTGLVGVHYSLIGNPPICPYLLIAASHIKRFKWSLFDDAGVLCPNRWYIFWPVGFFSSRVFIEYSNGREVPRIWPSFNTLTGWVFPHQKHV